MKYIRITTPGLERQKLGNKYSSFQVSQWSMDWFKGTTKWTKSGSRACRMAAAPERSRRRTNHRRRARRGGSERNLTAAETPSQFGFRKEAFVTSGLIHAQMVVCHAKPSKISFLVLKNAKADAPCHPLAIYKFAQTLHLRLPVPAPFVARNSTTPRYPSWCYAGELPDKGRRATEQDAPSSHAKIKGI